MVQLGVGRDRGGLVLPLLWSLPCLWLVGGHGERSPRGEGHPNRSSLVSPDCGGGRVSFPCGKGCPRTCEDLHPDTACVESARCLPTCGCPDGRLLQEGACVTPAECRCKSRDGWSGEWPLIPARCPLHGQAKVGVRVESVRWLRESPALSLKCFASSCPIWTCLGQYCHDDRLRRALSSTPPAT